MRAVADEGAGNYEGLLKVAPTADTAGATLGSGVNNPNLATSPLFEKNSGTNPKVVAHS
jgi:hypothetical protein